MTTPTETGPVQLADLLRDFDGLRRDGHLDKRRTDILSISHYARVEAIHSAVVAWLLDPTESHGLGASVLNAILAAGWGARAAEGSDSARVDRESGHVKTRTDIIVELGPRTLVIENKVDAPEQLEQCEHLFREWGSAALYLLLSPDGHPPTIARSAEARHAWRSLSYGSLSQLLSDLVVDATEPARIAIADYIETLESQFASQPAFEILRDDGLSHPPEMPRFDGPDPFDSERFRFVIQNRSAIKAIDGLKKEFEKTLRVELKSLARPVQQLLDERHGPVGGGLRNWRGSGATHPMFWRPAWVGPDGEPLAAIGLDWDSFDPSRKGPYCGLFVHAKGELRDWLTEDLKRSAADEWVPGQHPVAYRYNPAMVDWYKHLPAWREGLAESVDVAWLRFAPRVDAALNHIQAE